MNANWVKRSGIGLAVILLLVVSFVAADYFGLFGVKNKTIAEFMEFRVKTLDAETGLPISNVKVRCFQYGTNNACGQRPSHERGVVRISLYLNKNVRDSLLFRHAESYAPIREKELRVMYIHTEYGRPVQHYSIPDLMQNPGQTYSVELQPLIPAAERESQESGREAAAMEPAS